MCPRKLCKTCAQGSPDKSQKICAIDVWGHRKMCRDCAQFVREGGGTCTILAEYWGGVSENVRAQVSRSFR